MGGPSWEQKSTQNRSDIEVLEGPLLGIVFCAILEGFGTQVGTQNRTQIDQKSTLVSMENTTPKPIREKSPERPEDGSKREDRGPREAQKIIALYAFLFIDMRHSHLFRCLIFLKGAPQN